MADAFDDHLEEDLALLVSFEPNSNCHYQFYKHDSHQDCVIGKHGLGYISGPNFRNPLAMDDEVMA